MGEATAHGAGLTGAVDFAVVDRSYLLVISIPCYVDDEGSVWVDPLWSRDLVEHLSYLKDLVLCAPRLPWAPGLDLVRFEVPPGARLTYTFLPSQSSVLGAVLHLPRTLAVLWRAIRRADIVHSSVIGWPFPLGWLANPIALLMGKRLVIVVESSWLMEGPERADWRHRLLDMNPLRVRLARWSCNHADLALFTQAGYRDTLCTTNTANAVVTPAVWVNEADILDDTTAAATWASKIQGPARFLFAGRLVALKGIDVLLDALRSLEAQGSQVSVDIIGQGEARDACTRAAASFHSVRLSVLDPVPYGKPFFELVRRYHAVLVPSLSDEQPRIIFDASAQAVPVIASDTAGLRPYIDDGVTGWLAPQGDVVALAAAITHADRTISELRDAGLAALRASRGLTHKAMHRRRSHLLKSLLD